MVQAYKRFNSKMDKFAYILLHNSYFARIIAALAVMGIWITFNLFLIFFPYLMTALNQFRQDSLDQWYLVSILIAPVIIFLGAIFFTGIVIKDCGVVFIRGSFYKPFTFIKGKIEIKRELKGG